MWNLIKLFFGIVIQIYDKLILLRCILSFLPMRNKFTDFVDLLTEPVLAPCRKLIEKVFGVQSFMDFSPIVAFLILDLIGNLLYRL